MKPEEVKEKIKEISVCKNCNGDGFTAEHDLHPHPDGDCCGACPIQVQCEYCHATGIAFKEHAILHYQMMIEELEKDRMGLPSFTSVSQNSAIRYIDKKIKQYEQIIKKMQDE